MISRGNEDIEIVSKSTFALLIIIITLSGCMTVPFVDDPVDHPCDAKYNFFMHPRDKDRSLKACNLISNWSTAEPIDTAPLDKSTARGSGLGMVNVKHKPSILSLPGWSGVEVRGIEESTELEAIKETDYWVYVKTSNGDKGWVAKKWLQD